MSFQKTVFELAYCCDVMETGLHFDWIQLKNSGRLHENVYRRAFSVRLTVDLRALCRYLGVYLLHRGIQRTNQNGHCLSYDMSRPKLAHADQILPLRLY